MSTTTTTTAPAQINTNAGSAQRGRRTNRGRNNKRGGKPAASTSVPAKQTNKDDGGETKVQVEADAEAPADDGDLCWICAEPVKYYSVSECNHRICHVCSLRLRALYKKRECTLCKVRYYCDMHGQSNSEEQPQENQATVVFTTSPDTAYQTYDRESMTLKDEKLDILFETQEMMEETLILLRFNCPDSACDYIAKGWSDLKLHVRATHNKLMW